MTSDATCTIEFHMVSGEVVRSCRMTPAEAEAVGCEVTAGLNNPEYCGEALDIRDHEGQEVTINLRCLCYTRVLKAGADV